MGGYFNEFRREGVSAPLMISLREAVRHAITASGGDVGAITRNANTFRAWYGDPQNAVAVDLLGGGGAVNQLLMAAVH